MAVIRDNMPAFELFQPASTDEALGLLEQYGTTAWVLAGGLDTWDWLKDRVKRPAAVVDLGAIAALREIRTTADGVEIGAMVPLTEVERSSAVRESYGLLAAAAAVVASPQIRNQGTLGGNLSQDTRCWYYRDGWNCYRAGGNICYADTPTAMNREHCIVGASRVCGGEPVGHGAGAGGAGRAAGGAEPERRAGGGGGGLFCGPGGGHRADDGAGARGPADGGADSGDVGERAVLL